MSEDTKKLLLLVTLTLVATGLLLLLIAATASAAQKAHYGHDGPALLPDRVASPGDVAITDKAQLCPVAHTRARRHVTAAMKREVCREYDVPADHCNGKFVEIDHIVSLELGGSNAVRNLFPQPWEPRPGAHEKDRLENWLHKQVCEGKMTLGMAQAAIASDWYGAWQSMQAESASGK